MVESQIIVIPAYEPDKLMVDLVRELRESFSHIVIVNDGSGKESDPYFEKVEKDYGAILLKHPHNKGKGAALKTAFHYVLENFPRAQSVIMCDADGQHLPIDILHVSEVSAKHPRQFIFGVRHFDRKNTPLRSWFGNVLTQFILKLLLKTSLKDTQTGLRAYPITYIEDFLRIPYDRYEYDTESIILISQNQWRILTVPIQTVYLDGNARSHFNPLIDSLKIYWVIAKFSFISILSFFIDLGIFSFLIGISFSTLPALFISRLISAIFNFVGHRRITFKSSNNLKMSILFYTLLWIINIVLGAYIIDGLVHLFHWNKVPTKVFVDILLFVMNFFVSRFVIFPSNTPTEDS